MVGIKEQRPLLRPDSLWWQAWRRLTRNRLVCSGILFLIFMFLFSFIGPFFSPYLADTVNVAIMEQPPTPQHWLGTDELGRDVLTRLMLAGRISLTVGIASMLLSVFVGTALGALSGFYGGIVDQLVMRLADILMSIPGLPLLIIIGALLSEWKVPGAYRIYLVMLMLGLLGWSGLARLIRGQILSLREQPFMMAAEVLGLSDRNKIWRHLIPNIAPLLLVVSTLNVAGSILNESVLSFLGLGVVPPLPSWGNMIDVANNIITFQRRPWLWIPPGVAIFLTVVFINVIGDGLRDVLDPKLKGR